MKKIQAQVGKIPLYAPKSYWRADTKQRSKVCNGCGAKGGIKFPDTFWGLNMKPTCNIHDWMFNEGQTYGDYLFANAIFILNMVVHIINNSNLFTAILRFSRATKYFIAVMSKVGLGAFWANKKRSNFDYRITFKGEFRICNNS